MTITSDQIILLAAIIGAIGVIVGVIRKPFDALRDIKKSLDEMSEQIEDISEDQKKQGDMVYQLLKHAATNNNTGEMQRALDEYNEYFRH